MQTNFMPLNVSFQWNHNAPETSVIGVQEILLFILGVKRILNIK